MDCQHPQTALLPPNPSPAAYEHNGHSISAQAFYAIACDPRRSVAVEACAGAGKTWMLVSRIVRALLDGAAPDAILAITFTKKAAGEMRERLNQWLVEFAQASPEQLHAELVARGLSLPPIDQMGHYRTPDLLKQLSNLYQTVLDAGRSVQLRTFHGWFAALLRNAPLAVLQRMGLPASYQLLEDDAQATAQVWQRFYLALTNLPEVRADFGELVAVHGRFNAQKALAHALSRRVEFALADAQGVVAHGVVHWTGQFPEFVGYSTPDELLRSGGSCRTLLSEAAAALARGPGATPRKQGLALSKALKNNHLQDALAALLTRKGEHRKNMGPSPRVRDAQTLAVRMTQAITQHQAWLHHQRMVRLTRVLLAEYAALKQSQGWVDMNDVEQAALTLLADPVASGWVQERLDGRIKQVLIDEFQDTNPLQWQALSAWLGSYAGASGGVPSVFIVGDPKQSIYRFRRAQPQVFQAAKRFVVEGLGGDTLACDHTRRNAPSVLAAVNAVFETAQNAGHFDGFRLHTTDSRQTGAVSWLPPVPRTGASTPDDEYADDDEAVPSDLLSWRDTLSTARLLPEDSLRMRESRQAAHWIAQQLADGEQPKNILVLARKRDRLASLHDALRVLRIPAWQPEKTDLAQVPEVQDIVALLDALVSPDHNLSLARALRSPLFAVHDTVLVALALQARQPGHEGLSWLDLLLKTELLEQTESAVQADLTVQNAPQLGPQLQRWQSWLHTLPPHDALQAIYQDGDVLARFAQATPAALRTSVLANLRALLGAVLSLNGARYATPYALVRALKASGKPTGLKAAVTGELNAVRLLTVHGAKGLEAACVLLLDSASPSARPDNLNVLVDWPGESAAPRRFSFLASETQPPACAAGALATERTERAREELNALYVAMTRARTQLVFSSVEPAKQAAQHDPSPLQRLVSSHAAHQLPEPPVPQPLAGSQAANADFTLACVPYLPFASNMQETITDTARAAIQTIAFEGNDVQHADLPEDPVAPPQDPATAAIGLALHRLLEWAPVVTHAANHPARIAAQHSQAVAREFALTPTQTAQATDMALRILQGQAAWAWHSEQIDWHANEVSLAYQGRPLRLDRLVRHRASGVWWVLDYKSTHQPLAQTELLAQLRHYRAAVQAAQPGQTVRAAFLTSDGAQLELTDADPAE
jgi:ATP-dependent helicase/nuclease subunit A